MPFCRARLSAKRFIAGVGGYAPAPLPTIAPSKGAPPLAAPSLSLPMIRWATSHTASIAPTISCLPIRTSSSRHSSCAVTPGSTSAGSACLRTPNKDRPVSVRAMFLPWAIRKSCLFSPPMISARVAGVPMPLASFVCDLGDDPRAKAHRSRRGRAAASLHAVGIVGHQPDPLRLDPEPFGDDLREARLVALARRHRPQYQLDGARRIDRQLGPLARRTTRKRRRRP